MKITISTQTYSNKIESEASVSQKIRKQYRENTGISVKSVWWNEVSLSARDFYDRITKQKYIWTTGLYYQGVRNNLTSKNTINKQKNGKWIPITPFDKNGYLRNGFNSKKFWSGSYCVFVDIDKTSARDIRDYVSRFNPNTLPTFGIYSASDKPGDRRFKLVYCFDYPILDGDEWDAISKRIHEYINNIEPIKDPCGQNRTQISYVGTGQGEWFGNTYDRLRDFSDVIAPLYENTGLTNNPDPPENQVYIDQNLIDILQRGFKVADLKYIKFVDRIYRTESEVQWLNPLISPIRIGLTKTSYWQLFPTPRKDGQRRRLTLFKRMCLRRIINPLATPEQILLNAYMDREDFIDNSDGKVSVDNLVKNVRSCFSRTVEELKNDPKLQLTIEKLKNPDKDDNFSVPSLIFQSPDSDWTQGQRMMLLEEARLEIINVMYKSGYYDPLKSEEDNIEVINTKMEEWGFRLRIKSRDTLIKFRKKFNIAKSPNKPHKPHKPHKHSEKKQREYEERDRKIRELYSKNYSVAQIIDELALDGITVKKSKVYEIIKSFSSP